MIFLQMVHFLQADRFHLALPLHTEQCPLLSIPMQFLKLETLLDFLIVASERMVPVVAVLLVLLLSILTPSKTTSLPAVLVSATLLVAFLVANLPLMSIWAVLMMAISSPMCSNRPPSVISSPVTTIKLGFPVVKPLT